MAIPDRTLPEEWLVVLDALKNAPSGWTTPAELACELGQVESELSDLLADLDVAGWVSVWERPEGPAVILSSRAAALMGLRLEEKGGGLQYRWVDAGDPEPGFFRARNVTRAEALEDLDLVFDPQPTPDEALEALDLALQSLGTFHQGDIDAALVPAPSLLLGQRLTPWPGPNPSTGPCPVCRGRTLQSQEYCLRCDRWGLDAALSLRDAARPRPQRSARPSRASRGPRESSWRSSNPARPRPRALAPDAEARQRKAARKARLRARLLSESSRPRAGV